jgi:hypothetical protein
MVPSFIVAQWLVVFISELGKEMIEKLLPRFLFRE